MKKPSEHSTETDRKTHTERIAGQDIEQQLGSGKRDRNEHSRAQEEEIEHVTTKLRREV